MTLPEKEPGVRTQLERDWFVGGLFVVSLSSACVSSSRYLEPDKPGYPPFLEGEKSEVKIGVRYGLRPTVKRLDLAVHVDSSDHV